MFQGSIERLRKMLRPNCDCRSIEIINGTPRSMIVCLEPWADEFELLPQEQIRIDFIGKISPAIPVTYLDGIVIVEGWEGATAEVWKDQQRIG